jgi:hypothetical protein
MADFSINKLSVLGDVQKSYNWLLNMNPPQSVKDAMGFGDIGNDLDSLSMRCRSTSIPGKSFDVITAKHYGAETFFAGQVHYTNTINLVFEEFVTTSENNSRKIARCFYTWQDLVLMAISNNGNKSSYAINFSLMLLKDHNKDLEEIPTKFNTITMYNAWPETVAEVPLSYADSNSVQYSVGFRYDYWDYAKAK